jgi:hypothetical protein
VIAAGAWPFFTSWIFGTITTDFDRNERTEKRSMTMANLAQNQPGCKLLDKRMLQEYVAALDERMGFVYDPTVTAEQAKAMMLAHGIRPEDNILTTELIRMRHEYKGE